MGTGSIANSFRESFSWIFHPNRLVAWTTLALAVMTFNLANVTTDQFKIRSYPSFAISLHPIEISGNDFSVKITNRGELNAFKVSIMLVHSYTKKDSTRLNFNINPNVSYDPKIIGEEELPTYKFERIAYKGITTTLSGSFKVDSGHTVDNVNHTIVFIRFSVPYEDEQRYQSGYFARGSTGQWNLMAADHEDALCKRFFESMKTLTVSQKEEIEGFFDDYSCEDK